MQPSRRQFLLSSLAAGATLAGCLERDDGAGGTPTHGGTADPITDHSPMATPGGPDRRTRRQVGDGPLAVVGGSAAFVAADGTLRSLALDGGDENWTRSPGALTGLALAGGTLFSLATDGTVRRHGSDGSAAWTADLAASGRSLAVAGETVVALGDDGSVAAFASSDGTERWRESVAGVPVGLAANGTRAYVTTDVDYPDAEAWLAAFDAGDGTERWRAHPGNRVPAPPAVVGEQVLVGTVNAGHESGESTPSPPPTDAPAPGYVVAYGPDGSERWTSRRIEGSISWLVGADERLLVGHRGFAMSDLSKVSQVSGLGLDGTRDWRREKVTAVKPAAVTRGVALHVAPAARQSALRATSGAPVWSGTVGAGTAAAAGDAFVTVGANDVRARDALTGQARWSTDR